MTHLVAFPLGIILQVKGKVFLSQIKTLSSLLSVSTTRPCDLPKCQAPPSGLHNQRMPQWLKRRRSASD